MINTKIIEFTNINDEIIRWVETSANPYDANSNNLLVCIHGFERCSTTEKKFKSIADKLSSDIFLH